VYIFAIVAYAALALSHQLDLAIGVILALASVAIVLLVTALTEVRFYEMKQTLVSIEETLKELKDTTRALHPP
jgi:hypothetical protein